MSRCRLLISSRIEWFLFWAMASFVFPIATVFAQEPLGNGHLAIHVNKNGALESLYWPGPGGADQIHRNGPAFFGKSHLGMLQGGQWGIISNGNVVWQSDSSIETTWDLFSVPMQSHTTLNQVPCFSQRMLLLFESNVLLIQLIPNDDYAGAIYWFQDFNPTLVQSGTWPSAVDLFSSARDFAAYFDEEKQTLYHFRPKSPSSGDWGEVRNIGGKDEKIARTHWANFKDGVWIGTGSSEPIEAVHCLEMPVDQAQMQSFFESKGNLSVCGDAASFLKIVPNRAQQHPSATLCIAIGENKEQVDTILAGVRSIHFDSFLESEKARLRALWAGMYPDTEGATPITPLMERAVNFLFSAWDFQSGAFIHAPRSDGGSFPPSPSVWFGDVAWVTEALLALNKSEIARKNLDFCLKAINGQTTAQQPAGSLPFAFYTNGKPATAPSILDTKASAEALLAVWRYAKRLDPLKQAEFLSQVEASKALLSEYLSGLFNNADYHITSAFQVQSLKEEYSQNTLVTVFLGLLCSREITAMQGLEFPMEYAQSLKSCESRLRFAILNETDPWPLHHSMTHWMTELLPPEHPLWKAPIKVEDKVMTFASVKSAIDETTQNQPILNILQAAQLIVELARK